MTARRALFLLFAKSANGAVVPGIGESGVEFLGRVDDGAGGVAHSARYDKRIGDGLCGWISCPGEDAMKSLDSEPGEEAASWGSVKSLFR